MKNELLIWALISVVVIAVLNYIANFFYFYWSYWWFDNIAHFLGGVAIGLFGIFLLKLIYSTKNIKFKNLLLITIVGVLIVGIGWEIFEYFNGTANPSAGESYVQDTTLDLIDDIIGAIVAATIIFKRKLHV